MVWVTQQLADGTLRVINSDGSIAVNAASDSKTVQTKVGTVARTNTTAKNLFKLPAGAIPIAVSMYSPTASDAQTTAVVSIGRTGTNTYFVATQDVKGVSGQIPCAAAAHLGSALAAETQVVGIYAETGTASATGGPFTVIMSYYLA